METRDETLWGQFLVLNWHLVARIE